ncbi:hypothetical protein ACJX0J_031026, partial [Zea mays]
FGRHAMFGSFLSLTFDMLIETIIASLFKNQNIIIYLTLMVNPGTQDGIRDCKYNTNMEVAMTQLINFLPCTYSGTYFLNYLSIVSAVFTQVHHLTILSGLGGFHYRTPILICQIPSILKDPEPVDEGISMDDFDVPSMSEYMST